MKLYSLSLYNFQSHAESRIDFGNVTTIVGNTNAGKTAAIRALRAFVDNAPPRAYVRDGASELGVMVVYLAPDNTVKAAFWAKGKSTNVYKFSEDGGNTWEEFSNVGTEVPTAISSTLQMGAVIGPRNEKYYPNFRTQIDLPAIVYESEGDRLSKLVKISGIGVLQTAVRLVTKDQKSLSRELASLRSREKDLHCELKRYDGVEAKVRSLEAVSELVGHVQSRQSFYEEAVKYREQMEEILKLEPASDAVAFAASASSGLSSLRSLVDYRKLVDSVPPSLSSCCEALSVSKDRLHWLKQLTEYRSLVAAIPRSLGGCDELFLSIFDKLDGFSWLIHYKNILGSCDRAEAALSKAREDLSRVVERRNSLRGQIDVCPVCGK